MRINFLKSLLFLVLLLSIESAIAQKFTPKKRYWSFGGSLNAMNYAGDNDPNKFFISPALLYTRWNLGACALYRYTSRMSFRGALAYGRIQGDDRETQSPDIGSEHASGWRYIRGTNFTNDLFELKVDVVYDFLENRGKYNKRVDWTPYVFAGLAYFYQTPKSEYNGVTRLIKDVLPPGKSFSAHQFAIPFGMGVRIKISKQLDLAVEMGMRKTFTGYLDGVKGDYSDPREMSAEQQLYDNPSMVGYGTDPEVTKVINAQGIAIYDKNGANIADQSELAGQGQANATLDNRLTGSKSLATAMSMGEGNYYITPVGFGWKGDKKAEFQPDWYWVFGVHLTYIIPERVQCPKYRD